MSNLWELAKTYTNGAWILTNWLGSNGVSVDQELAQARANKCLVCPKNKPGIQITESVAAAVKQLVEFKNEAKLRVVGEKRLYTCSACLCPLPSKVWQPIDRIRPDESEKPNFDAGCWLLHE